MGELNGTQVNGVALNGVSMNSSWVPPSTPPYQAGGSTASETERARLEAEVAAANARTAAAKQRVAAREAEVRAALHAELIAARDLLAEMERQHEVTIAMVRSSAQAEVERILAAAHHPSSGHMERVATDEIGENDAG